MGQAQGRRRIGGPSHGERAASMPQPDGHSSTVCQSEPFCLSLPSFHPFCRTFPFCRSLVPGDARELFHAGSPAASTLSLPDRAGSQPRNSMHVLSKQINLYRLSMVHLLLRNWSDAQQLSPRILLQTWS